MPLSLAPKNETESLPSRLRRLRSRFHRILLGRQGSQAVVVVLLLTALFAWLDWRYRLPALIRAFALAGTLTTSLILTWRIVIAPWRRERTCLAMAHRVERQFPEFNDSLSSAVQFLDIPEERQIGSALMRQEAIDFAADIAADVDLNDAVSSRGLKRSLFALVLAVIGAGLLLGRAPTASEQALTRLFNPFGADEWPAKTFIAIQAPLPLPHRLARHEWFELRFQVRGALPDRVNVSFWDDGGRPVDQAYPISKNEQAAGEATVTVKLEPERVERSFRFRIRANDADSGWQLVEVQSPPVLAPRDGRPSPQIHLAYPAYTDLPPVDLPDGSSVIETVVGTRVWILAATDRPVASARLLYRPPHPQFMTAPFLAPMAAPSALSALGSVALGREIWSEIPVALSDNATRIDIDFTPRLPGIYVLRIEDETGIGSERAFDVRVEPDPSPHVALLRPTRGDALSLAPDAVFDLIALIADPRYAVRQVYLEYRTAPDEPFRRVDCFDWQTAVAIVPPLLTSLLPPPPQFAPVRVPKMQTYALERKELVRAFVHPDGSPLKDGDVLSLRVSANDFDDVTFNKPAGHSDIVDLPIVAKNQIDAALEQALLKVRTDLLQLRDLQRDARQTVADAVKALENGPLSRQQRESLQKAEETQKGIQSMLGAADDGLLARLARMLQAARDNRLPPTRTTQQIESTAAELNRLTREELGPIEKLIEKAVQDKEQGQAQPSLAQAERHQREVQDTLQSLLDRLEPWSGAGEARGEARSIVAELRKQYEQLKQMLQRQKPGTAGSKRDDLSEAQRAELDRAALPPERSAERIRQLFDKLEQMANDKDKAIKDKLAQNPDEDVSALKAEAEAIRRAIGQANGPALRKQLQDAPAQVRNNQLDDAGDNLKAASAQLEKLVQDLADKRQPADVEERLQRRTKEAEAKLDQLIDEQERLQKKIDAADKIGDPQKRADELRKLSREQEKLREQAQDLVKQLTRAGNDAAAQELRRAARQMEETGKQLERGQAPEGDPDTALNRLDDARDQIEKQPAPSEEQLTREKTTQAADRLKALRERQAAANEEEKRLQAKVLQERKWSAAAARSSLPALIDQQEGLARELRDLIDKQFENEPVFARMLRQSASAMDGAVNRLNERKEDVLDQLEGSSAFDADLEARADRCIGFWQELALKRMDQLLEALKPEPPKAPAEKKPEEPGEPKPEGPAKMRPPGPSLPPLAQLKALRALQADTAERTAAFAKAHPDPTQLTADEAAELEALRRAQNDVAELVLEATPTPPSGDEP
jgi:hypothetical protein